MAAKPQQSKRLAQRLEEHSRSQLWLTQKVGVSQASVPGWFRAGSVSRAQLAGVAAVAGLFRLRR